MAYITCCSLRVSYWTGELEPAWYCFSCDLTYIIARGQECSKDCCAFAGDSVSVVQTGSED